jgi:nucleotide-binding universal stress UspA family protein
MVIEVFSVKNFSSSVLKEKLEDAMRVLQLPYTVRENHNIEDFIQMGLTSIPAVKVGRTILSYKEEQSIESTIEQVVEAIESNKNRYILVPVDFTEDSLQTLRYAIMLARADQQDVLIAHIHEPVYDPMTGSALDQHLLEGYERQMKDLISTLKAEQAGLENPIAIKSHFAVGDKLHRIARLAESESCALVIMTTHAAASWTRKVLGTFPLLLSKKIDVPLLAVPPGVRYVIPQKVVVAVPPDGLTHDEMEYCISLVDEHAIFLDFIYVSDEQAACKTIQADFLKDEVVQRLDIRQYAFHQVRTGGDPVETAISDYAEFARAHWIVFFNRHHSIGEALFHHSIRKHSVVNPAIPILLMPANTRN